MCMLGVMRSSKGIGSPRMDITVECILLGMWVQESNLGLLEEQPMLLSSGPSFQPQCSYLVFECRMTNVMRWSEFTRSILCSGGGGGSISMLIYVCYVCNSCLTTLSWWLISLESKKVFN